MLNATWRFLAWPARRPPRNAATALLPRCRWAGAWVVALAAATACGAAAEAAESATAAPKSPAGNTATRASDAGPWKLDRVVLRNGQVYRGLIEQEDAHSLRFLEIRQPEGRALYAVYMPLELDQVAKIERLSAADRAESLSRFQRYRSRGRVEAGQMQNLTLTTVVANQVSRWRYQGTWFQLESSAAEETTRRAIVRLEQVFAAYSLLIPPRRPEPGTLRIMLYGSLAEYRAYLQSIRLSIDHVAFYAADANLVAAGSDLDLVESQLAQVRLQHKQLRDQLDALKRDLPDRLRQKREQLEAANTPEATRRKALLNYKRQMEEQIATQQKTLDSYDRKNETTFRQMTDRMFATLYHEAFHAYLENFVYPRDRHDVPRWLNEGLAQCFEAGLLEADTLRVDAPNRQALALLQADLASAQPLSLREVLLADHRQFLVAHGESGAGSARHYAYSWGLAYYLAFERPLLGSQALDRYVARPAEVSEPVARFEQLVDSPLANFEAQWRQFILRLKPNGGRQQ